MTTLRPFRAGDETALADICLRTADAGADATGILADDAVWAEIFVLPYVARHPDLAFVVETDSGRAGGYVVATDDTAGFEAWFRDEWWPPRRARWSRASGVARQDDILAYADGRGDAEVSYAARYPAHLHIDLLPDVQGRGWGRRLIAAEIAALSAAGARGVHLVASAENIGACAFYRRLGFAPLPSAPGDAAFALDLDLDRAPIPTG